jgi:membrane-bound lytic murein transglycosylase MltF
MIDYLSLIQVWALLYNLDPRLVSSMVEYESHFNPNAIGTHGEIGLLQLTPIDLHISRKKQFDPETNISKGCAYIQEIKRECKFKEGFDWLVCYNLGATKGNKLKHPKLFPYYKNVMKIYNKP